MKEGMEGEKRERGEERRGKKGKEERKRKDVLTVNSGFNVSHCHVLLRLLVKSTSLSTGEHVGTEQPGEVCSVDSKLRLYSLLYHCKRRLH